MTNCKQRSPFVWFPYLLIGVTSILAFLVSPAQEKFDIPYKRCPIKTINYEQGLMNNSITGVITDAKGFTWFSTKTGLQLYNGYSLQTITPVADGDTMQINYPVYFSKSNGNNILIGCRNSILVYSPGNSSFKKIIPVTALESSSFAIEPLKQTSEGIWCLTEKNGIILCNTKGIIVKQFSSLEIKSWVGDMIRSQVMDPRKIVVANDHFIFIRMSTNSVLQLNLETHQLKTLRFPGSSILGLECNQDRLFIASTEGLFYMNINNSKLSKISLFNKILKEPIAAVVIAMSGNDHLLVSTEKRLFEFDTTCICRKEITTLNHEFILNTGSIQLIYEDDFKRIWLLTNDDIKRVQDLEIPFDHYIYPAEKNNFVRSLYYDNDKNILLAGCFNGGIQLYDSSGHPLWQKPLITKEVIDVNAIEKLSADHYLIETIGKGLYLLTLSSKQLRRINVESFSCPQFHMTENTFSNGLQRIDANTILISTQSNVFRFHTQKNSVRPVTALLQKSQVDDFTVSAFTYSSNKTLWVGTVSGVLLRLDAGGNFKTISLPENYGVRCMAEDAMHNIWVGTEKGLYIYNNSGILIRQVTTETGLLNDFIYALLPADSSNNFIASSNLGLSFISLEGNVKNYTKELGLQDNEFNTQSCTKSINGKLFFGGVNGITAFYPRDLFGVKDSSLINITRLIVNDSLYNPFAGAWKNDTINLAYNKNHLVFDIAATGQINPNEYLYRYRMNGFDESWQTTRQPTGIRYTLIPGKYLLEIDCSPLLSSGSNFHKKFMIIIAPPWWKTWWFIIASMLIGVLLIFSIAYFMLKQQYQLKLGKLEMQHQIVNERERISRELHDNIGSQLSYISSNIDWLVETPESFTREEESKRLSIVNDTAKNLVTDLRETIWAMKKESIMLDELADKLKSFLQAQCILQPQIEMIITENIEKKYSFSPIEALNIFRICQEAIVNSIRHSKASKICFNIQSGNDESFSFTIEDNGKGFILEQQYSNHYGLENMKHRANESGMSLFIQSTPGTGTKVTITKNSVENNKQNV
ncbi:MAG: histidine kinase [Bacteroidota bacterium]|nr:histidine kinase [Bacteroidota bacterium]